MFEGSNILLVTDNKELANSLVTNIETARNNVDIVEGEKDMLSVFDSRKPVVLIFHHKLVEDSQDLYFALYKGSRSMLNTNHRAILLCDHADVARAYEKCMRNIFFDYVMVAPKFDVIRINLSIRNAIKSIELEKSHEKNKAFSSECNRVSEYSSDLSDVIEKSDLLTFGSKKSLDELSSAIKNEIKEFSTGLINKSKSSDLPSDKILENEVKKFSSNVIDKNIDDSRKKIQSVMERFSSRLESNQNKIKSSLKKLNSLSASLPKKVLIVEDNEIYGEIVSTMLEQEGAYQVKLVASVHQGLVSLVCDRPDVVLLDYELEDGDASIFLDKVSTLPGAQNVPIIMLTSHNTRDVYTSTVMLGALDFIVKPASKEAIIEIIEKHI